jgi:hypothetical protein
MLVVGNKSFIFNGSTSAKSDKFACVKINPKLLAKRVSKRETFIIKLLFFHSVKEDNKKRIVFTFSS